MVELPDPTPDSGQLVLGVLRCGICGSDLHAREHCDGLAEVMEELDYDEFMRTSSTTVLGHEFVGEVRERGRGARREFREGAHVVSFPLVRARPATRTRSGFAAGARAGTPSRCWSSSRCRSWSPTGSRPTSPCSPSRWRWRCTRSTSRRSRKKDVAIVLGCGPVGLAVICWLKARGVRTDRRLRPLGRPTRAGVPLRRGRRGRPDRGVAVRRRRRQARDLGSRPVPPRRRLDGPAAPGARLAPRLPRRRRGSGAATPSGPVVFECVGVPGMIESVVSQAPLASRVVVVGVCMGGDSFRPSMAINKELDLRFVLCYTPLEFRDTLHALADGKVDASALVTGTVGLDGVADAFEALGDPERHAKILIDPASATRPRRSEPWPAARPSTTCTRSRCHARGHALPGPRPRRLPGRAGAASSSSAPRDPTPSTPRPASATTT